MKYKITLSGKTYEVEVEAGKAQLLSEYEAAAPVAPAAPAPVAAPVAAPAAPAASAPAASAPTASGEVISSPMPGNILRVEVSVGQQVKEGDVLMILEAMKMENEIVATKSGAVAQILAPKGTTVDTGTPLAVIA